MKTVNEIRQIFSEKGVEIKKITTRLGEIKVTIDWKDYLKVRDFYSPNVKLIF